ncbi:MAG: Crp/Fnr family transcriptional regulator [Cyclobacteriaceae bacterium]
MNKIECLIEVFGAYISEPDIHSMADSFSQKSYKAGETIVPKGKTENHFYLVESGVQMLYVLNSKGDKNVLGFSFHPTPSGAYDSFMRNTPSELYFESITASSLWAVDRVKFQRFNEYQGFMHWRASFAESILFGRLQREIELTTLTAKERFWIFEKRIPLDLQMIPQKYLASYLNMSPETFSRIRGGRD